MLIKPIVSKSSSITGAIIAYPEHLMDVFTKILDEYKTIKAGDKILMEVSLYNLGTEEIKDAKLKYCIETSNRSIVKCNEETVAIYTKIQLIKEFLISSDIQPGEYFIKTEVTYDNDKAVSETSFEVLKEKSQISQDVLLTKQLLIIIIIIVVLIGIILLYKKIRNKLINYIDYNININYSCCSSISNIFNIYEKKEKKNNKIRSKNSKLKHSSFKIKVKAS